MATAVKLQFPADKPKYDGTAEDKVRIGRWHAYQEVASGHKTPDKFQIARYEDHYRHGFKEGLVEAKAQRQAIIKQKINLQDAVTTNTLNNYDL